MARDNFWIGDTLSINPSIYTVLHTEIDDHILHHCIICMELYADDPNAQYGRIRELRHYLTWMVTFEECIPIDAISIMEIIRA